MKTLLLEESFNIVISLFTLSVTFRNKHAFQCILIVILFLLMFFYRQPFRDSSLIASEYILSPSDGVILSIEKSDVYHIKIFLSIFDVHVQWYPVNGYVKHVAYKPGQFNIAYILEKSDYNEKSVTTIEHCHGIVEVSQIAGQLARRIVNKTKPDTFVRRGDLMGMIKLSSRVDIKLPLNSQLLVQPNDRVYGNITKLARWMTFGSQTPEYDS